MVYDHWHFYEINLFFLSEQAQSYTYFPIQYCKAIFIQGQYNFEIQKKKKNKNGLGKKNPLTRSSIEQTLVFFLYNPSSILYGYTTRIRCIWFRWKDIWFTFDIYIHINVLFCCRLLDCGCCYCCYFFSINANTRFDCITYWLDMMS